MKLFLFILAIFLLLNGTAFAQAKTAPCALPEASQFDFWLGSWNLTWNDTSHGTNNILKIMGGCTINENFSSPSANYHGASWSVYNPKSKMWQQTWVDDSGAYIALTGTFENGIMTLSTEPQKLANGDILISRMVFFDISHDKFNWRWESNTNRSKEWKVNWLIHYSRNS